MRLWLVIVTLLGNGTYLEDREGPFLTQSDCLTMARRTGRDANSFAYCDDGCGIERDYYLTEYMLSRRAN